jgi:hypothetical protein
MNADQNEALIGVDLRSSGLGELPHRRTGLAPGKRPGGRNLKCRGRREVGVSATYVSQRVIRLDPSSLGEVIHGTCHLVFFEPGPGAPGIGLRVCGIEV